MSLELILFRLNNENQSVIRSEEEANRELEKYIQEHPKEAAKYYELWEEFVSGDNPVSHDEFLQRLESHHLLELLDLEEAATGQLPSQQTPEFTKELVGSIIDGLHAN